MNDQTSSPALIDDLPPTLKAAYLAMAQRAQDAVDDARNAAWENASAVLYSEN